MSFSYVYFKDSVELMARANENAHQNMQKAIFVKKECLMVVHI
jgi:hypothetical protein